MLIDKINKDIVSIQGQYPKLKKIKEDGKLPYLKGFVAIKNPKTGGTIDFVNIKVQILSSYPYSFPKVYEIGGKFPKSMGSELHINADESLCLDVKPQEIITTKKGMNLQEFFKTTLIPNLCWRICILRDIPFDKKDWPHNFDGNILFYRKYLNLDSQEEILKIMEIFLSKSPNRNWDCFCGSKKKYKFCHAVIVNTLFIIGRKQILEDYNKLKLINNPIT